MSIDPENPVIALCAAGMAIEGDAVAAGRLFQQAWEARRDDYDACIAAHFLARHQPTVDERLRWNAVAARHAEAVPGDRARELKASLYLNLADANLAAGNHAAARAAMLRAIDCVADLTADGYRSFVERGIERLKVLVTPPVADAGNIVPSTHTTAGHPGDSMTNPQTPAESIKRAEPESFRGRNLTASLTVNDLQKSLAWYRDVLGFTVDREHQREGKVIAVSLKAGDVQLLIGQDDGAKGLNRVKGEGFSLQFTTVQSVDEIAKRIKDVGGTLDSEPADMPWGPRVFRVRDPDGFRLVFSSER